MVVATSGTCRRLKLEVRLSQNTECFFKRKKEAKCNGKNKAAMGYRQEKHLSENSDRNAKKPIEREVQGKTPKQHKCDQCEYNFIDQPFAHAHWREAIRMQSLPERIQIKTST